MKYTCADCGKSFVYAAKKTEVPMASYQHLRGDAIEKHVCPYYLSLNFDEAKEPQPEITSIKSVDIAEADEWIAKGYRVLQHYAKTVTVALEKEREMNEK